MNISPHHKKLAIWIGIVVIFLVIGNLRGKQQTTETNISYTEFLSMVENERVAEVIIQGQNLYVTDTNQNKFKIYAPPDNDLIKTLRKKGVVINAKEPETGGVMSALISWLPMLVLVGVWIFFIRQMQNGGGGKMGSMGKSRAILQTNKSKMVTFEDVAGIDEAKEELGEIVEFLRNPTKFTRLGGRIPKGILLMGPPGTGKTLLGRAIAGEAGVPFYSISGSDFVEMFVGVGASRVRDLFLEGKKHAPCIIFIDEIDAVGRHRGAGLGGGHDEREQTLNQLLVEMDGFETNEGVILVSATNRPDVLDPALLRPGRFDRQVVVSMPDIKGREMILKVHMKKTPIAPDVKPLILAKGTPGFSGADLENLVNEAAMLAAKRDKEKIEMIDFEESKDKVYMGLERKSRVVKEEDRRVTAYHEGGHALVARFLPGTDAVNKVTIVGRGLAAGITWFLPEERDFRFKDELESELVVAFGGRAAEDIIFNRISTGAANDIKQATGLAQQMIRIWGMSEALGPLSYAKGEEQVFLGREIAQHRDYSEATAQKIDEEVIKLIKDNYQRATDVLNGNIDILHALAELLLEKETVLGKELDELIMSLRPGFDIPGKPLDSEVSEGAEAAEDSKNKEKAETALKKEQAEKAKQEEAKITIMPILPESMEPPENDEVNKVILTVGPSADKLVDEIKDVLKKDEKIADMAAETAKTKDDEAMGFGDMCGSLSSVYWNLANLAGALTNNQSLIDKIKNNLSIELAEKELSIMTKLLILNADEDADTVNNIVNDPDSFFQKLNNEEKTRIESIYADISGIIPELNNLKKALDDDQYDPVEALIQANDLIFQKAD